MASLRVTPPLLYTAAAILPPVCTALVVARFATRIAQRARLGWDDWLVLPALVLVFGMAAAIFAGTALKSLGYPTPLADPAMAFVATSYKQTVTRKIYWIITLLQTVALSFIKTSCLLFYGRVFRTGLNKLVDVSLLVLSLVVILWGISFFFGFLFICRLHFDYVWTNIENELKCASTSMADQALSVSDVVMDCLILIFPMPLIWRLQMSAKKKFAVTLVFLLGTLAITASIARTVIIYEELNVEFAKNADEDFVSTAGLYFMFIEACFALCAICLPTLSGAFKLDGFQSFVNGFQSLFSLPQRSWDTGHVSTDSHKRLGSQHSGSDRFRYHSDAEESSPNMELQDAKEIRRTKIIEHTHSLV